MHLLLASHLSPCCIQALDVTPLGLRLVNLKVTVSWDYGPVDLTTDEEHHSLKRFVYRIVQCLSLEKRRERFLHLLCVSIDNYVKPPTGP